MVSKILRPSTVKSPPSPSNWQDLPLVKVPNVQQLEEIRANLDLILLALEALTEINSEIILEAAQELKLDSEIAEQVIKWRLGQSNPWTESSGESKELDVQEARSLVLIICYLARYHQELIRRGVTLLEQMIGQDKAPHRTALLGDYLDNFSHTYQERRQGKEVVDAEQLAFKLLIDLLFYSGANGHHRLWLTLLDYGGRSASIES